MPGKAKQIALKTAMIKAGTVASNHSPALCNGKAPSSLEKNE